MQTVQKQALPVILQDNDPVAILYFTETRERVLYKLIKADEEDITTLLDFTKTNPDFPKTKPKIDDSEIPPEKSQK